MAKDKVASARSSRDLNRLSAANASEPTPKPQLTQLQGELADLCGQVILYGASKEIVGPFVDTLLQFQWDKAHPNTKDCGEEYVENHRSTWLSRLRAGWRKVEEVSEPPEPKTITERIRNDYRGRVLDLFEDFAGSASPEEVLLMISVLEIWQSEAHHGVHSSIDIPLADAFNCTLGEGGKQFLTVSRKEWERFKDHVGLLEEAL